ncbi:MAG: hypothetical protein M0011_04770 [Elusimicrobia bacterium]|nr:hypothetical protein [Elusimicrobiota bacterium]
MNYKLRIKHPSGAEFEAEGPADFIRSEKEGFLGRIAAFPKAAEGGIPAPAKPQGAGTPDWGSLTAELKGLLILKEKHPGLKAQETALLLLAAGSGLRGTREISAISLSKAIKASGYAPERLDRTLARALRDRLITASGSKRNRTYRITDRGLEIAWLEARKLAQER